MNKSCKTCFYKLKNKCDNPCNICKNSDQYKDENDSKQHLYERTYGNK